MSFWGSTTPLTLRGLQKGRENRKGMAFEVKCFNLTDMFRAPGDDKRQSKEE